VGGASEKIVMGLQVLSASAAWVIHCPIGAFCIESEIGWHRGGEAALAKIANRQTLLEEGAKK